VTDLSVLDQRPSPGLPRPYHFPRFSRSRLANGLTVISVPMPGRPLLAAELVLEGGAVDEPPERAGVTWLAARALSEGTARRDANAFIEATERLGAAISSGCSWEVLNCSLAVPRRHIEPALGLLAEMLLEPALPETELERLRAQRLNDLLQAAADPARRAERVLAETLYLPGAAYRRPLGGDEVTVPQLGRDVLMARYLRLLDPGRATLVVAGDLEGIDVVALAERLLGAWQPAGAGADRPGAGSAGAGASEAGEGIAPDGREPERRRVVLVDRPGAAQSEVRVGHVGLARHIDDYHAVAVLQTMLGGLFNSRLQRLLREVRGYTYHVSAGFAFRRAAGPFAVRTAVQTEVTVPAIRDILDVLGALTREPPTAQELAVARDYLVGVFPLRFEEADRVAGAVADLVAMGLPDDEFDRYRPGVAAVTAEDVVRAAAHVRPDDSAIVLVGDADAIGSAIEEFGPLTVVRDESGESA
jgi:zinc protease